VGLSVGLIVSTSRKYLKNHNAVVPLAAKGNAAGQRALEREAASASFVHSMFRNLTASSTNDEAFMAAQRLGASCYIVEWYARARAQRPSQPAVAAFHGTEFPASLCGKRQIDLVGNGGPSRINTRGKLCPAILSLF
jgi:hypothetical protein